MDSTICIAVFGLIFVIAQTLSGTDGASQIEAIGNELQASRAGVDTANSTFLLTDAVLGEGVLFAYAAFFRELTAVRFQVWRLFVSARDEDTTDAGARRGNRFQLVYEARVIPSVIGEEVVYIAAKLMDCFHVLSGDRVGIFQEEAPGAVSYVFDASQPSAMVYQPSEGAPLLVGDVIEFDTLVFPYDLSVRAYIDTDMSQYTSFSDDGTVECPAGLLIPAHAPVPTRPPTTVVPPTGAPGEMGETGPTGAVGARGIQGARGVAGTDGQMGPAGVDGADGVQGPTGRDGSRGDGGATGQEGPRGLVGEQGEVGPRGRVGPAGPKGDTIYVPDENNLAPQKLTDDSDSGMPMMTLILLIWVALITIFIIIIVVVFVCVTRRRSERLSTHSTLDDESSASTEQFPCSFPASVVDYPNSWMGTLKEGAEMGVSVDVISTTDSVTPPAKDSMTFENDMGSTRTLVIGQKPISDKDAGLEHWTKDEINNY